MKNIKSIIASLAIFVLAVIMLSGFVSPAPVKYIAGTVGIGLFIFYLFWDKKESKNEILSSGSSNPLLLQNQVLPYVSYDYHFVIICVNNAFTELFPHAAPGISLWDYLDKEHVDKGCLSIGKRVFQCSLWQDEIAKHLLLFPQEAQTPANSAPTNQNTVAVCHIFIDNYDEVLESVEEARRPILTALIDRKINSLSLQAEGVVKKFEKDRYIFLLTQDALEEVKKRKFEILEQIREINMGNKLPVTLSIGIGINGDTLAQNMEFSRNALDLAMGRGGDQVLIKDGENYQFFGGMSKGVERTSNVRARVKAYALLELMREAPQIFIMGHKNPDMDSFGAAIGIYRMAASTGKKPFIILDSVTTNIKRLYDQVLEDEDYSRTHFLNCEQAIPLINDHAMLVVVDTHMPTYCSCPEALDKTAKIVVIDHHRRSTDAIENTVLTYHEPYASSTCELVTEMLQYVGQHLEIRQIDADCLLAGITVDTKYFTIKTGSKTFEAAAYLKRNGADTIRVRMALQNDMISFVAKALAVSDSELFMENIAISKCVDDTANPALTAAQAADELLNIEGIQASFVLARVEEKILISARSLGSINVQRIMEKLGGGGHQTVAGAQIADKNYDEIIEMIKQAIIEFMEEENA